VDKAMKSSVGTMMGMRDWWRRCWWCVV